MKRSATEENPSGGESARNVESVVHRGESYQKVLDGRKRAVRGLWIRNGRYYGQIRLFDESTGRNGTPRRIALGDDDNPVETITDAKAALAALISDRDRHKIKVRPRAPQFAAYVKTYLERARGTKRPSSIAHEKTKLNRWAAHFGDMRLRDIRKRHILALREKLLSGNYGNYSPNTVNKYQFALNNVFKMAIDDEIIDASPGANLANLKFETKRRQLLSAEQIEAVCKAARENSKNGELFSDYVWLLTYSGARRNEGLALKWSDVDFERGQLHIGSDGDTKNQEPRTVDMSVALEAHLRDVFKRRQPDSAHLFPSPRRVGADRSTKTFQGTLKIARKHSGVNLNFHDLRHFFISKCVMAGLDFMTIAKWAGHKDGGILIGKVYGHLADDHRKRMAEKVSF